MRLRIHWLMRLALCLLIGLTGWNTAHSQPVSIETFSWYTQDRDFVPIEPAPWVYQGVQKAFVSDLGNPNTLQVIDQLATAGVTVIHTGGPEPYYPLKRDGGKGTSEAQRLQMQTAFARMRTHKMRIVIGVSPYAPVEYVTLRMV